MKLNARRGFTLAEVLVTVTITAVLAAVVVPSVVNQVKKGDSPSFTSEIQAIGTAVGQYATDNRALPSTLGDLVSAPSGVTTWKGPYLSTGQDLSTTSSVYTAAAYGLTYADTIPAASNCAPANYMPIVVTKVNGVPITDPSFSNTNTAFKALYDALYNVTSDPPASSAVGSLQYSGFGAAGAVLHICMIAAKVS